MKYEYESEDIPEIGYKELPLYKITYGGACFLDNINGIIYHYHNPTGEAKDQTHTLESEHPWTKADIVCCDKCKDFFDI